MAVSSTLTGLLQTLFSSWDVVSREVTGFIAACRLDAQAARAAVGQTVTAMIPGTVTAVDTEGSNILPDTGDQSPGNQSMTITKSRTVWIRLNGEQSVALSNTPNGPQYETMFNGFMAGYFQQAFRTLGNEIETDLAAAIAPVPSRAYGAAGTPAFGTANDLSDPNYTRKILLDNGAPLTDLSLVMNSTADANFRSKQSFLWKVNEAGSAAYAQTGILAQRIQGTGFYVSGQLPARAKGTGTLYVADGAQAIGATSILLKTGSGTVVAGDVVTFAGDTNKYVVATGVAAPGAIVINAPGLRQTLADGVAMTIGALYNPSYLFDRNALVLAARLAYDPPGGDIARATTQLRDPATGLVFELKEYAAVRAIYWAISIAWGVKATKAAHTALLLG